MGKLIKVVGFNFSCLGLKIILSGGKKLLFMEKTMDKNPQAGFLPAVLGREAAALADQLLDCLGDRNGQVARLFFGVEGKKHSLAAIGKKMGITRERTRQIKVESLKKIRKVLKNGPLSKEWADFQEKMIGLTLAEGGFLSEKRLAQLFKKETSLKGLGKINFLLTLDEKNFSWEKKTGWRGNFWFLLAEKSTLPQRPNKSDLEKMLEKIGQIFKEHGRPLKKAEVGRQLEASFPEFFPAEKADRMAENLLLLGIKFKKNILGQWGLVQWPEIAASVTKEKAFLVLKKNGKPLHFRQIAELIKEYWPGKRVILQTVHNELIKDVRFALVGRGVYGLCQWGFVKSPIKKIVWDFIRQANRPMEKEEILEYVLKLKQVKRSTVSVCLSDKKLFQKNSAGRFLLAEKKIGG